MSTTYTFSCDQCSKPTVRKIGQRPENKGYKQQFCSQQCLANSLRVSTVSNCAWCGNTVVKTPSETKKSHSGRAFCNRSCSISYNNTQKRKSRRSKCEKMLFDKLVESYPELDIVANSKSMIEGYEVDIAIPSLKVAIEWNGIVHFKPIYGDEKLEKIQNRDRQKLMLASNNNINLIVIPDLVSTERYVLEAFHKIRSIIDDLNAR